MKSSKKSAQYIIFRYFQAYLAGMDENHSTQMICCTANHKQNTFHTCVCHTTDMFADYLFIFAFIYVYRLFIYVLKISPQVDFVLVTATRVHLQNPQCSDYS